MVSLLLHELAHAEAWRLHCGAGLEGVTISNHSDGGLQVSPLFREGYDPGEAGFVRSMMAGQLIVDGDDGQPLDLSDDMAIIDFFPADQREAAWQWCLDNVMPRLRDYTGHHIRRMVHLLEGSGVVALPGMANA